MRASLYVCLWICLILPLSRGYAQQPDTACTQQVDSLLAIREFLTIQGPAEAAFVLFSPPPYRFNSGVYTMANPNFPLLYSPDSLVRQSIRRAHKQRRIVRVATIATAVPLLVITLSAARLVLGLGAVATGNTTSVSLPDRDVIRGAGVVALVGVTVSAGFNIASLINIRKGIRRHNGLLGRQMPTLFNPKGL